MMKFLVLVLCILAVKTVRCEEDACFTKIQGNCDTAAGFDFSTCNAQYGNLFESNNNEVITDIYKYANTHIQKSFEYLLMSTYFETYETNRPGIAKKFRELSDKAWENSQHLIKYVTKRGGVMDFSVMNQTEKEMTKIEKDELRSFGKALGIQKELAKEAHSIHLKASKVEATYDPDVTSYLEKNFLHEQSESIRVLSGYINDLRQMFAKEKHASLALFLFDEYLQK